jgi:hypothetical protein
MMHRYTSRPACPHRLYPIVPTSPPLSSTFIWSRATFCSLRSALLARHRWQYITLIPFWPMFFLLSSPPACDWAVAKESLPVSTSVCSGWVSEFYCKNLCHYSPEFILYYFVSPIYSTFDPVRSRYLDSRFPLSRFFAAVIISFIFRCYLSLEITWEKGT